MQHAVSVCWRELYYRFYCGAGGGAHGCCTNYHCCRWLLPHPHWLRHCMSCWYLWLHHWVNHCSLQWAVQRGLLWQRHGPNRQHMQWALHHAGLLLLGWQHVCNPERMPSRYLWRCIGPHNCSLQRPVQRRVLWQHNCTNCKHLHWAGVLRLLFNRGRHCGNWDGAVRSGTLWSGH